MKERSFEFHYRYTGLPFEKASSPIVEVDVFYCMKVVKNGLSTI